MKNLKVLVTGAAGFIGYSLSRLLLTKGCQVFGLDNLNDYYDPEIKKLRLSLLSGFGGFNFEKIDIENVSSLERFWQNSRPDVVVHLAAQAGVRYSLERPDVYINTNIQGFQNMIDLTRKLKPSNFVYASSSSVYGVNNSSPFSESQPTLSPSSLYAATKISNEAVAFSYSHLFDLNITGLRFFTVYGPYGRPDMALFKFARLMLRGEEVPVYNFGKLSRDWTYIDDIVSGITAAILKPQKHAVYNLGKGAPDFLEDAISYLEEALQIKALRKLLPMQSGDVYFTHADLEKSFKELGYSPKIHLKEGIQKFTSWVRSHPQFFE